MDLIVLLRRVPLFEHFSDDQLELVADISEERRVASGTTLCRQADVGSVLFLIDSGEAVVHHIDDQGCQRPVGMIRAGEWFGVTSLLLGQPHDVTITSVTEMRLWTIRRPDLEEVLAQHPRLRRALAIPEGLSAKLRAARYPWVEPDEVVTYHSRRHWTVFVGRILLPTVLALAVVLSLKAFTTLFPALPNMAWWYLLVLGVYVLLLGWSWVDWRNDSFVVSSRRIAHSERSLLRQSRAEAPIDRIQSVNVRRGPLGGLLNYGDLTITTAARVGEIRCDRIPHPEKMREAIFAQIARRRAIRRAAQRHLIRSELASRIDLGGIQPLPADSPADLGPIDRVEEPEPSGVRPGKLSQILDHLARLGIIPCTRMEVPDSVTWRKHWVFLALGVVPALLLSLLLGVATFFGFSGQPRGLADWVPHYPYVALLLTALAVAWFWWRFSDWTNDLYVVTDERIIDIEKRPLFFAQERREASLGMIQNVSLKMPNPVARILNYGYVLVQTAGSGDFTFDRVPNPREVQREIFRRMESYRKARRKKEAAHRRAEMGEWFTVYDTLRHQESVGGRHGPAPKDEQEQPPVDAPDGQEARAWPPSSTPDGN